MSEEGSSGGGGEGGEKRLSMSIKSIKGEEEMKREEGKEVGQEDERDGRRRRRDERERRREEMSGRGDIRITIKERNERTRERKGGRKGEEREGERGEVIRRGAQREMSGKYQHQREK